VSTHRLNVADLQRKRQRVSADVAMYDTSCDNLVTREMNAPKQRLPSADHPPLPWNRAARSSLVISEINRRYCGIVSTPDRIERPNLASRQQ
jgi:hypothetical protein